MHNQNRAEYKARMADPAVAAKLAGKASQWTALTRELASRRVGAAGNGTAGAGASSASSPPAVPPSEGATSTLKMIEKLLTVNPDPAHLWNHRRELLLLPSSADVTPASADDDAPETSTSDASTSTNFDLEDELKLTAACLQRNPKAYAAWFHRKWAVRHWLLTTSTAGSANEEQRSALLQTELGLCASFLDRDERNFHCWNYRRYVVALILDASLLDKADNNIDLDGSWKSVGDAVVMGPQLAILVDTDRSEAKEEQVPPESIDEIIRTEFEYTSQRIEKNFSNCSAFHYRSKLIDLVLDADLREEGISRNEEGEAYQVRLDMSRGELEMVQSAVFTEPDDQTAWWYHRFVLAWARPKPVKNWTDQDAAAEAFESFAEVLEEEKESIRELVEAEGGKCKWGLLALHMVLTELMDLDDNSDRESLVEEANDCIDQLTALDPDRATRYKSMRR